MLTKSFLTPLSAIAVALSAGGALAQSVPGSNPDYSVTQAQFGSFYESEPGTGVTQLLGVVDDSVASTTLPFAFTFFGTTYNSGATCYVSSNGWISLTSSSNSYGNATYPTTSNGVCLHAYMEDLYVLGAVKTWVSGSAPNRKWVVSWQNMRMFSGTTGGNVNIQAQVFETTGSIRFSYQTGSGGSWGAYNGVLIGLQGGAPTSTNWVCPADPPLGNTGTFTGQPPHDYAFDKFRVTFSGRVLYDRYTVDSAGVGNASEQNVPLASFRVESRTAAGATSGFGLTDVNGNFSFDAVGVAPDQFGSVAVVSQTPGAVVKPTAAAAPYAITLFQNVSYAANADLGTAQISEGSDPGGALREPMHIARAVQIAYDWARVRTAATIPQLGVVYSASSASDTSYSVKGINPAEMRIGGPASNNPDAWDTSVIQKTYGSHVLGSIAADSTTQYVGALDAASDATNAFSVGFGAYLWSAIATDPNFRDGTGATTSTVLDLEDPALTTPLGPDVAGCVAGAFYDLLDAANEPSDLYDGQLYADRVFQVCDSFTTPVTASSFFLKWATLGFDGAALSTVFIHHGLIPDDDDEPNDSSATSRVSQQFGFIRKSRVLSLYNEDWYEFTMAEATDRLTASIVYDRLLDTVYTFDILDAAGTVLASGAGVPEDPYGPVIARTGALPAGVYRLRLKWLSGGAIPTYSVQAFSQLAFTSGEFTPWTVHHDYEVPVAIQGGVPPYRLTIKPTFEQLDGLVLDGPGKRVWGTPNKVKTYDTVLTAEDSAEPSNLASGPIKFQVNAELKLGLGPYFALPYDKPANLTAASTGGTRPFTTEVLEGVLPSGLTIVPGELRFTGTPDVPGGYPIALKATDVATSTDTATTTAVVCVPFGVTPLAMGRSACGFYFDVVAGTSVGLSVKTSKKRAKRALALTLLDVDGTTVLPSSPKNGTGKASLSGFVAPKTGRYYCVVSSETGDATELACAGKLAPPKKGAGAGPDNFVAGRTFAVEIGALAGASLKVTGKPDGGGLALKAVYMFDPAGNLVPFVAGEVVEKSGGVTATKVLPASGTWKFVFGAAPGPQGKFTYTYAVKQPKGTTYSAD